MMVWMAMIVGPGGGNGWGREGRKPGRREGRRVGGMSSKEGETEGVREEGGLDYLEGGVKGRKGL